MTIPKLNELNSSCIKAVGYFNHNLYITFNTGFTYVYYDVPENVYNSLISASSAGQYFNKEIRENYKYAFLG